MNFYYFIVNRPARRIVMPFLRCYRKFIPNFKERESR